jgi:hypothetical protein
MWACFLPVVTTTKARLQLLVIRLLQAQVDLIAAGKIKPHGQVTQPPFTLSALTNIVRAGDEILHLRDLSAQFELGRHEAGILQ